MTTDLEIQINNDPFLETEIFSGLMNLISFFKETSLCFSCSSPTAGDKDKGSSEHPQNR